MREATLYTLQAQNVMAGDYVELRRAGKTASLVVDCDTEGLAVAPLEADRFAVPVHRVMECCESTVSGSVNRYNPAGCPVYATKDHFIAMDPAVEEVITAICNVKVRKDYSHELQVLKYDLELADHARKIAENATRSYRNSLAHWWSQPWWKRVWDAATSAERWRDNII